jgi:hypothetical protein
MMRTNTIPLGVLFRIFTVRRTSGLREALLIAGFFARHDGRRAKVSGRVSRLSVVGHDVDSPTSRKRTFDRALQYESIADTNVQLFRIPTSDVIASSRNTDEAGRQAHLNGPIAQALGANAPKLLAQPPSIERIDVLGAKLPG